MYNRVILMGRIVADPELRQTQSGISMCRIRVAVDRRFSRSGEERQSDFFDVTCWRQTAEFVCKYFTKGRMIHVEGTLQNDNYTDQNGVKHYSMNIIADNVTFCGDKRQDNGGGYSAPAGGYGQPPYGGNAPQYGQPPQQQYAGNAPQYGGQPPYQQQSAPAPAAPPQAAANKGSGTIELGNLGDFEEILSDGEVPF